jgi:NADH dehydrogenase (ubiquinone) 1 alpha subcomplex subunit 5
MSRLSGRTSLSLLLTSEFTSQLQVYPRSGGFQQSIDAANLGSRVHKLEQQIGAGLIEEIIEVAEGELQLIDTMEKSKV